MMQTFLLACSHISEQAKHELQRAGCPIHKDVLEGYDADEANDVKIVELQYASDRDLNMLSVWGAPREIQIRSRELYLYRRWDDDVHGFSLTTFDEAQSEAQQSPNKPLLDDESLGDLDDHPF